MAEGLHEDVYARALKAVLALQIKQQMRRQNVTAVELAKRMRTSRSQLNRLIGSGEESVTLDTIARAATALGCELQMKVTRPHRSQRARTARTMA